MMKKTVLSLFTILTFLLSGCSIISDYTNNNKNVVVSIKENETFEVLSENPQTLKKGSDASFRFKFLDDYAFESASSGVYANNILTIKNVMFSQTIAVTSSKLITVTLTTNQDPHFLITSSDSIKIKKGEDAIFDVELEPGYKFESSENYKYIDGKLIFTNIQETCSVFASAVQGDMFKISILNNDSFGTVTINPSRQYYDYGDVVNISVNPLEGNQFICLSENKDIHSLNNAAKPYSFKKTIDLIVTRDFTFVVNYHDPNDYLMKYYLNGGLTFEGNETLLFDYKLRGFRTRPNSLINDSCFFKDGYYLDSFNTKEDGTGTRIGIGSRIDTNLFTNKTIELFCQWVKETDVDCFETIAFEDGVQITKYLGSEQVVVIPSKIDAETVKSVKSGSFENKDIQKVFFPISLTEVQEQAFVNCPSLKEIHYWTSLQIISDSSFIQCDNLTTISINCSTYPKYLNSFARGNYADKLDCAQYLSKNGSTILAVGSSTLQYNHSFNTMESVLGGSYYCYNLACLFAMPLQIMYDFALGISGADDLVLIQLHETQASRTAPVSSAVFAYLEGDMDRFLTINYQNHKKYFLSSWRSYKTETSAMADQMSYEYYDRGLKNNGDYIWSSEDDRITDDNKGSGVLSISSSYTYDNFKYLLDLYEYYGNKSTLLTFDTYNKNAIINTVSFYAFESLIKTHFGNYFTIISDMDDSIIEGKYFRYSDNIHLNCSGGEIHCTFLANKIKNIFGK